MTRILIVDDERDIRTTLAYNLTHAGYRVFEAGNAFDAIEAVHDESVDLVVLDWVLPDMPGIDLCRKLKADARTKDVPVVMLTARADEIDRVVALEVGADDYITKPFSVRETVLRIQRLVRPRAAEETVVIRVGCMTVDQGAQWRFLVDATPIHLTRVEFHLLATLAGRTDFAYSRSELLECVWKRHGENFTRTVDSHVKRLRQKLGKAAAYIQTVQGVGYRFSVSAPQPIAQRPAVKSIARRVRATGRRSPVKLLQRREARMSSEAESAVEIALEPARKAELDSVLRLLSDSNLPVADLESHIDAFTLAKCNGIVVGTAGLEIYGELALLRSLCVAERHRSKLIGVALVSAIASRALAQGVREHLSAHHRSGTLLREPGDLCKSSESRRPSRFEAPPSLALCARPLRSACAKLSDRCSKWRQFQVVRVGQARPAAIGEARRISRARAANGASSHDRLPEKPRLSCDSNQAEGWNGACSGCLGGRASCVLSELAATTEFQIRKILMITIRVSLTPLCAAQRGSVVRQLNPQLVRFAADLDWLKRARAYWLNASTFHATAGRVLRGLMRQ